MHPRRHINSELQQLLRGQSGSGAVLLGKGRIGLQHPTLPQEVEKVSVRSIFNGYVQVTWTTQRRRMRVQYSDILYVYHYGSSHQEQLILCSQTE